MSAEHEVQSVDQAQTKQDADKEMKAHLAEVDRVANNLFAVLANERLDIGVHALSCAAAHSIQVLIKEPEHKQVSATNFFSIASETFAKVGAEKSTALEILKRDQIILGEAP